MLFLPVVNKFYVSSGTSESIRDLKAELSDMKVWIASSLHRGEEEGTNYLLFFFFYVFIKIDDQSCMHSHFRSSQLASPVTS